MSESPSILSTTTPTTAPRNSFATAALTVGIVSFALMLTIALVKFAAVAGGVAVVLGIIALRAATRSSGAGRARAVWGTVLGGIPLALGIVVFITRLP